MKPTPIEAGICKANQFHLPLWQELPAGSTADPRLAMIGLSGKALLVART